MTKDELLAQAATIWWCHDSVIKLGRDSLSAEQITQRSRELSQRLEKVKKFSSLATRCLWVMAAVAWVGYLSNGKEPLSFSSVAGSGVSVFFLTLVLLAILAAAENLVRYHWTKPDELRLLKPVAGTDACETALHHLESGGELTRQWRDLAIVERGQLHQYDSAMLTALHECHEQTVLNAKRHAEYDEACRKLHGLVEISPDLKAARASEPAQPALS